MMGDNNNNNNNIIITLSIPEWWCTFLNNHVPYTHATIIIIVPTTYQKFGWFSPSCMHLLSFFFMCLVFMMSHAVAVCWLVTSAAAAHGDAPSHVKGDAPSRAKELLNTVHNTLNNIVGLATELKVASTTESTTTRTEGSAKLDHIISQAMSAQSSVASLFMHPGTALHRQPQQAHSPLHGTADYPEAHRHSRNTQHSTVHTGRRGHSLSTPGNLSASADPWASSIDEGSAAAAAAPTPTGSSAGHSALLLPFCVDGDPQQVSLSCTQIAGAAAGLCAGLLRIQQASCAQLSDHAFVQSLVERVGLTPDGRGSALYGKAAASIVPVHGKSAKHKVCGPTSNSYRVVGGRRPASYFRVCALEGGGEEAR